MPKSTSKDGVKPTMGKAEANVPIMQEMPMGFKETAPGIVTHAIGKAEPSIKTPAMRMGAAKPWMPKGGHAVAAADAHDPPSSKPSMRFKPAPKGSPVGPTGIPAGQADAGGYSGASGGGGYS